MEVRKKENKEEEEKKKGRKEKRKKTERSKRGVVRGISTRYDTGPKFHHW